MSFRLAAYAVCLDGGRVLLAHYVPPAGDRQWTLPGGQVEHGEDPIDTVLRELAEETGRRRSGLVDVGLALARTLPPTGHVPPVPACGLIQH